MSFKSTFSVIAMAAFVMFASVAQFTTAQPTSTDLGISSTNSSTAFTAWAQFCDDDACSVNCGMWVDLMNSGCLNENGRGSIHVKSNGPDPMVGLVYSPGEDCNCQTQCDDFAGINPDCWVLDADRAAESLSYRFIGWGRWDTAGGQCDGSDNDCPNSALLNGNDNTSTDPVLEVEQPDPETEQATDAGPATDLESLPTNTTAPDSYTSWGQFCSDLDCNDCGISLDLENPACLTEGGRVAIKIHAGDNSNTDVALVWHQADTCSSELHCQAFVSGVGCFPLDPMPVPGPGIANTTTFQFKNALSAKPCECPPSGPCPPGSS